MKKMLCLLLAALTIGLCGLAAAEDTQTEPAVGYVCITVGEQYRWFSLPTEEPYDITIKQTNPETGLEEINVITITAEGVYMSDSTCDNQDCVEMGLVTLENKELRVLGNMVVCLPHQVMIQLYSTAEVMAMYGLTEEE